MNGIIDRAMVLSLAQCGTFTPSTLREASPEDSRGARGFPCELLYPGVIELHVAQSLTERFVPQQLERDVCAVGDPISAAHDESMGLLVKSRQRLFDLGRSNNCDEVRRNLGDGPERRKRTDNDRALIGTGA